MLRNLFALTCSGLLLAHAGHGQVMTVPRYTPTIPAPSWNQPYMWYGNGDSDNRKGSGSYQLPDGSWQPAQKMVFNGLKLTVKEDGKKNLTFIAANIRQLEVAQDTFLAVHTLPIDLDTSDFAEVMFSRHGVRVLRLLGELRYLVQLPRTPPQLLPKRKSEFKQAVLAIVSGCPALAADVATGKMGHDDIVQIMTQYVACQVPGPAAGN